jgi:uncharacterized protein YbjT (DUF2867 family)
VTGNRRAPDINILVTGATSMRGGAVARTLRNAGLAVSALVRAPGAELAGALARGGIALSAGDMEDPASLKAACAGRTVVFSVQPAPFATRIAHWAEQHREQLRAATTPRRSR